MKERHSDCFPKTQQKTPQKLFLHSLLSKSFVQNCYLDMESLSLHLESGLEEMEILNKLHQEMFPVKYSEKFYNGIIVGKYKVILLKGNFICVCSKPEEGTQSEQFQARFAEAEIQNELKMDLFNQIDEGKKTSPLEELFQPIEKTETQDKSSNDKRKNKKHTSKKVGLLLNDVILAFCVYKKSAARQINLTFFKRIKYLFTTYFSCHVSTFGTIQECRRLFMGQYLFQFLLNNLVSKERDPYTNVSMIKTSNEEKEADNQNNNLRIDNDHPEKQQNLHIHKIEISSRNVHSKNFGERGKFKKNKNYILTYQDFLGMKLRNSESLSQTEGSLDRITKSKGAETSSLKDLHNLKLKQLLKADRFINIKGTARLESLENLTSLWEVDFNDLENIFHNNQNIFFV